MKKIFITCCSLCILLSCNEAISTNVSKEQVKNETLKTAEDFFDIHKTEVLVVGTFYFDYPNLDALKVEEQDKIDVLSAPKQLEMQELIQYIKRFKPTKIGVEAENHNWFTSDLRKYNEGKLTLKRDERHQLGVKLAHELKLDTIYALDAGSFLEDLQGSIPNEITALMKDHDWKSDDLVDSLQRNWFEYNTNLVKEISLLDYIKHINTEESHKYGFGTYLTGDFRLGEYRGADVLSAYWYNRNLRIFRKLQEITESEDDRILLIFGNGHAALLRQFLSYSPEYEFVEFGEL